MSNVLLISCLLVRDGQGEPCLEDRVRETLKEGLRDYLNKPSLRLLVYVILSTQRVW